MKAKYKYEFMNGEMCPDHMFQSPLLITLVKHRRIHPSLVLVRTWISHIEVFMQFIFCIWSIFFCSNFAPLLVKLCTVVFIMLLYWIKSLPSMQLFGFLYILGSSYCCFYYAFTNYMLFIYLFYHVWVIPLSPKRDDFYTDGLYSLHVD